MYSKVSFASPKSHIFSSSLSPTKMFRQAKSRWMTPLDVRNSYQLAQYIRTCIHTFCTMYTFYIGPSSSLMHISNYQQSCECMCKVLPNHVSCNTEAVCTAWPHGSICTLTVQYSSIIIFTLAVHIHINNNIHVCSTLHCIYILIVLDRTSPTQHTIPLAIW